MPPKKTAISSPSKSREEVRQGPYPLSKGFDWSITDVNEPAPVWTRQSHICKSPPHFFVKECMNSCQRTTLKMSKLRSGFSIRRVLGDVCVEFSLGVYHRRSIFFLLYRSLKSQDGIKNGDRCPRFVQQKANRLHPWCFYPSPRSPEAGVMHHLHPVVANVSIEI